MYKLKALIPTVLLGTLGALSPREARADGLVGTRPTTVVSAPEFTVQNQAGQTRTRADLLGQPTAVWFFPMAGTPG